MLLRAHAVISVFQAAFRNTVLRRVGFAYALFGTAEFGIWITLLVFAYRHGGADASTLMVLVQLIPCIVIGPFLGALTDRQRPSRVLFVGYGLLTVSLAGVAVATSLGAPAFVVFILAPITSLCMTITRPSQAALLPAIVHTADELTAANVLSGWTDGAASLVGPGLVGLLLAWHGTGLAATALAAAALVATVLVAGVAGPAAAIAAGSEETASGASDDGGDLLADDAAETGRRPTLVALRAGARSNLAVTVRNPQIKVLLILYIFYFVLIGSLDVLCVVLALTYLHTGPGGAGYLNAALGGGALLAGLVTAFLIGRRRLANTLTVALVFAVTALALIDAVHTVELALLLIGTVGLAGAVFDVTGRTLVQRSVPSDAIAGSFSILEALMDSGLALGAILVRVALAVGGLKAALFAPGVIACLLIAAVWRRLRKIDASATIPQVEIQLLRSLPIFAALPPPSLEGIARELEPMTVPSGTVVVKEGDPGDSYYAIGEGELAISRDGQLLEMVSRGDGFGEIALIRDVPRQASVTAVTDALLYSLRKEPFIETVTGHATVARTARTIIAGHLDGNAADPSG